MAAIDAILKPAEAGDVAAFKTLFDRIVGAPVDRATIERIETLEAVVSSNVPPEPEVPGEE